jgi:hypothetical protein
MVVNSPYLSHYVNDGDDVNKDTVSYCTMNWALPEQVLPPYRRARHIQAPALSKHNEHRVRAWQNTGFWHTETWRPATQLTSYIFNCISHYWLNGNSFEKLLLRFEIFTAVTMKNAVFWDVAQCRSCVNRCFGETYRLHLQGGKSASEEPAWVGGCSVQPSNRTLTRVPRVKPRVARGTAPYFRFCTAVRDCCVGCVLNGALCTCLFRCRTN